MNLGRDDASQEPASSFEWKSSRRKKISLKVLLFNFKDHRLIIISNYLCLFFVSVMSLVSYVAFNGRDHRQNVCLTIESMYAIPFVRSIHVSRISDECLDSKFGVKLNSPRWWLVLWVIEWTCQNVVIGDESLTLVIFVLLKVGSGSFRAVQLCEWAPSISGCRGGRCFGLRFKGNSKMHKSNSN